MSGQLYQILPAFQFENKVLMFLSGDRLELMSKNKGTNWYRFLPQG